MDEVLNVSMADFYNRFSPEEIFGSKLAIVEINGSQITPPNTSIRLNAILIMIASRGEMMIDIDYLTYKVRKNNVVFVVEHSIIENIRLSHDFKGLYVIISKELVRDLMKEMDNIPTFKGPQHMYPFFVMEDSDARILLDHIQRLRNSIADKEHPFYRNIIRNELAIFLIQFITIMTKDNRPETKKVGPKEEIVRQFILLLIQNFRQEHEVTFYSGELCITAEYLSKILKGFSGKTANKWISDALISEAKILLRRPDTTVQAVAEELNFSDQSYFGKFFKKHTGKSPLEYRNSLLK